MTVSEHETTTNQAAEPTRRDFLYMATGMAGAVGVASFAWPFIDQMRPDASTLALASIEVDVSALEPGMSLTVKWQVLGHEQELTTVAFFTDAAAMDKILPSTGRVEVVGKERLEEIARDKIPVVFVSGHLSNWEVMPAAIVDSGVVCEMTYRAANNPYVDKRIKDSRFRYGVRLFAPKGGDGARELLEGMKEGRSVALMNDQKFNSGVAAPFFGHLAHTAPGPTRLAIRFGTVLQPMSVQRLKGARFRAVVHDPIVPPKTGDRTADIEAGVRMINAFMEDRIRERPAEWFWVHRRWPV